MGLIFVFTIKKVSPRYLFLTDLNTLPKWVTLPKPTFLAIRLTFMGDCSVSFLLSHKVISSTSL
ncbi:hypothetical protein J2T14_006059 [Paenibacillus harenae]|nr:hypothetical protein [Paenibacillus harenae]